VTIRIRVNWFWTKQIAMNRRVPKILTLVKLEKIKASKCRHRFKIFWR